MPEKKKLSLGKKNKKPKLPTKRYINLAIDEDKKSKKNVPYIILIGLVALGLFVKFGILDQLHKIEQAKVAYNAAMDELNAYKAANSEFDAIKKEYDEVTDWYMTEEENAVVDKLKVFKMLENDMMPYVGIQSVQISGDQISIETEKTTLNTVSKFLDALQNDKRVGFVTVTTAAASNARDVVANEVIAKVMITYGGQVDLINDDDTGEDYSVIDIPKDETEEGQTEENPAETAEPTPEATAEPTSEPTVEPTPEATASPEPASTPASSGQDYSKIANEVIRGDWDNGDERKRKLEEAGYNYDEVQSEVNNKTGGRR